MSYFTLDSPRTLIIMIRLLIVSVLLFIVHAVLLYTPILFVQGGGHISKWTILFLHAIFGTWVYPILVLGYILLKKSTDDSKQKFVKALIIIFIGYLCTWIPNFTSNGVIQQLRWIDVIIYPFLAFVLVKLDDRIKRIKAF